jgi:hypothetical protein
MRLKTCRACGRPFNLGDPVVLACGAWEGRPQLIHEDEALFDPETGTFFERRCFEAKKSL